MSLVPSRAAVPPGTPSCQHDPLVAEVEGEESILASVFGERPVEFRTGPTVVGVSLYDGPGRLTQPLDTALVTAAAAVAHQAVP
jgi:hypothetical protein